MEGRDADDGRARRRIGSEGPILHRNRRESGADPLCVAQPDRARGGAPVGTAWRQPTATEADSAAADAAQVILVDTSVWIDHLRAGDERLTALLDGGEVLGNPFITGELALSHLQPRD